jgi:cation transport ATPase
MIITRNFALSDIDCANCAAKVESKIQKIKGVENATVVFLTKKVTITAEEDQFDRILEEAQKAIHKVEPDCELLVK